MIKAVNKELASLKQDNLGSVLKKNRSTYCKSALRLAVMIKEAETTQGF